MSASKKIKKAIHRYSPSVDVRVKVYGCHKEEHTLVIRNIEDKVSYFKLYDVQSDLRDSSTTAVCEEIDSLPEDFETAYFLQYVSGGYHVRI